MIGDKKILSVILARARSQGIPGKNYYELLGKPLFVWSVLASLNSKYVDMTVVSSNCPYCRDIFDGIFYNYNLDIDYERKFDLIKKLEWIDRPEEFARDTSINEEALIHAYNIMNNKDLDADIIMTLQPTSPCRLNLVDKCIEKYYNGDYDSLLTASKDTPFIWQKIDGKWEFTVDKNGCCNRKMRQNFNENEFIFHDNGNLYLTDRNILLQRGCRIGDKPCVYETEGINSIQIDKQEDFEFIEAIVKIRKLESLIRENNYE